MYISKRLELMPIIRPKSKCSDMGCQQSAEHLNCFAKCLIHVPTILMHEHGMSCLYLFIFSITSHESFITLFHFKKSKSFGVVLRLFCQFCAFSSGAGNSGYPHIKESNWTQYLTPYMKINLEWIKDLKQSLAIVKLLRRILPRETIGKNQQCLVL